MDIKINKAKVEGKYSPVFCNIGGELKKVKTISEKKTVQFKNAFDGLKQTIEVIDEKGKTHIFKNAQDITIFYY